MKKSMFAIVCLVAALSVGVTAVAGETAWPPRRLTVVWHSAAGSAGDLMMRAIGRFIEKKHGVTVVAENRTGASGAIAWNAAMRSKPDGSTLQGVSSTFVASPLQNQMDVNYTKLDPVAMLFLDSICLFVSADSPYNTFADFIADAKSKPGELSMTGGTAGATEFVAARTLMQEAGVEVPVVPFEGGSGGVVAVMGGHVTIGCGEYAEVAAAVEGKKIKILAMFNTIPGIDFPSVADLGYKTTVEKFRGIVVAPNTPQAIKDQIFATLKEMMDDPEFKAFYTMNTLVPQFKTADEFYKVMERQTAELKESLANLN
jgi:putative tricarboxylic transport membrane protein